MPTTKCYLLTWTTYGSWLPGDERSSYTEHPSHPERLIGSDPELRSAARQRMRSEPVVLEAEARVIVDQAIRDHAEFRSWPLLALNVRSNHVHVVVAIDRVPERVMSELKSWGTRRLREAGLSDPAARVWTKHGSTRHLHDEASRLKAIHYVLNEQDRSKS